MNVEKLDLFANILSLGGLILLAVGSFIATNLAYQAYQKSKTSTSPQIEILPTI
jgi:hypothetical protein